MAQESFYTYRARVERVIDGDTFELFIDQGFDHYTVKTIRLRGVDTAEIYGVSKDSDEYRLGQEQKAFVEDFLDGEGEWPLLLQTYGPGKYGRRWIGSVEKDGQDLAEAILDRWPVVETDETLVG